MKPVREWIRPLTNPLENTRGIAGFSDWKFYVVLLLYAASFIVLVRDPFFRLRGQVVYQQGIVTLLLAVVLLNTAYWDLQLFGKPVGANLLLQVFSYLPGGMLFARLFGKATQPESVSVAEQFWDAATDVMNKLITLPKFPPWITDLVCNWKISIAFISLLIVLSLKLRKPFKVAAIVLFLLIPFLTAITDGSDIGYLVCGTLLLTAGLCFQFCRYDSIVYFEQIDRSLRQSSGIDVLLMRCIMRIMTRLYQDSKLSEQDVREIVAEEYNLERGIGNGYNDMEINQIAVVVTRKMIHSFNLVTIQQSNSGAMMYPNQRLYVFDSVLRGLAVWPRVMSVLLFAVVWSICPIDIIPDTIPIFGTLDDVFIGIATTVMLSSTFQREKLN